jgi:OmpA-OmpF porin, OOP family
MKKALLASIVLATLSAPALAQNTPWYTTVQAGQSKFDIEGLPGDNKDRLFLLGVGYRLTPQLALEGGYADFGKVNVLGAEGEAKSVYAAAMLSAPISDVFSVYGRLGIANTDREVRLGSVRESEKKTEGLYGIGLSWAFSRNVAATVEYMKLSDSDVDGVTLGVKFSF